MQNDLKITSSVSERPMNGHKQQDRVTSTESIVQIFLSNFFESLQNGDDLTTDGQLQVYSHFIRHF